MSKVVFMFPGQGSQYIGMAKEVYATVPSSRTLIDIADQTLGYSISSLMFGGPTDVLKQTSQTQPALLIASMALYEAFRANNAMLLPDYMIGHSLGEYSALVASGVLSFESAVRIVRIRGQIMERAVPTGFGAMAAVLGANPDLLHQLCEDVSMEGHVVEIANRNSPGQVVISGTVKGVDLVAERIKEAHGRRIIPLEVSGPFHCSLMKKAASQFQSVLEEAMFRRATVPIISNVTARPFPNKPKHYAPLLMRQLYCPVLWEQSIVWLLNEGVNTFVEIGPGQVLSGLIKKISKSARVYNVNEMDSMHHVLVEKKGEQA